MVASSGTKGTISDGGSVVGPRRRQSDQNYCSGNGNSNATVKCMVFFFISINGLVTPFFLPSEIFFSFSFGCFCIDD